MQMIRSFADSDTKKVFEEGSCRTWKAIASVAKRKLDMIEAAVTLSDLKVPPANKLEALTKEKKWKGFYSIRINQQYRVVFQWEDGVAYNVQIVDYH